jgi:hypothetical protein
MAYLAAGLSVLPAIKAEKRPAVGAWKTWAARLPSEYEVKAWFGNHPDGVCIVSGVVSGSLECMDFDNHGELFDKWKNRVDSALFSRLVVERTPSGGYHVIYRVTGVVAGNTKLARGERAAKLATLIETRGEGGIFLCAPTPGYSIVQGEFAHVPTLSADEHAQLLAAARELNEVQEAPKSAACGVSGGEAGNQPSSAPGAHTGAVSGECGDSGDFAVRPGDDFCARGDIRPVLVSHGWQLLGSRPDGNELWRRPGKEVGGHSATFDGNVFYVFSSNASPFESERGYSRFQVYATLECGGDYTRAARELLGKGYGQTMPEPGVDFSGLKTASVQQQGGAAAGDNRPPNFLPLGELVEKYPKMKPVLIHGFLRRGETMNIIAPPKTGKSWLVTDLALSVATGTPWFGFPCEKGKVLIIDNELHPETSANRIPKVVAARGIELKKVQNDIYVDNQRGRLGNIEDLANQIEALKPYGFKLIIIDAFYRAMPKGTDENDNGTVAGIYNLIDKYAAALDCAFILIHHTSKGNQSLKAVTDVGAGAGSQSRASDTHVILRRHKEQGVVVMESVVRSFPSIGPVCLRWNWPLWNRDDSLNPEELEGKQEIAVHHDDPPPEDIAQKLVDLVDGEQPMAKGVFVERVKTTYGIMAKTAKLAVEIAINNGSIRCGRVMGQPKGLQATKFITLPSGENDEN